MNFSLNPCRIIQFFSLLVCRAKRVLFNLIFFIMEKSHFFGVSFRDRQPVPYEERFTELIIPERNADGSITKSTKVLETVLDPMSTLSFTDYSINNMLAAGITPKSIHISKDIRIGSDKEIENFNKRVDELAEQMFNN